MKESNNKENLKNLIEPFDPLLINCNLFIILRSIFLLIIRIPLLFISFFIMNLYILCPYIPRNTHLDKIFAYLVLRSFGINVKIENLKNDKTYFPKIIMSNHISLFDHFIISYVLSNYKLKYTFVMSEFTNKTPMSLYKKKCGAIIIKQGENTVDKIREFFKTYDSRNDGRMVIYPEGRHGNGKYIGNFRNGGFLYKKDIQPILITSESFFLNIEDIKKGNFGLGMKPIKNKDALKYLVIYLLRILITPSINITVKLLPIFKKEEYINNDSFSDYTKSANQLRDIMLKYEKRMQKINNLVK